MKLISCRQKVTLPTLFACLFVAAAGVLLPISGLGSESQQEQIRTARTTLEKWIEARRAISQEKEDWRLAREMLNERVALIQHEIDSLRGKITETEKSIGEADEKRAKLVEENETLKEASAVLEDTVTAFEGRTQKLLTRLPDPIRNQVRPLSQRIPEDPDDTKMSLGERFQNVIGILNEINKFNGVITVTSEVRELPDGSSAEVTAVYIGIGQAYYANALAKNDKSGATQDVAGVGRSTPEGWVWTPAAEAGAEIRRAIAIYKNEEVADFVRLPLEIQ